MKLSHCLAFILAITLLPSFSGQMQPAEKENSSPILNMEKIEKNESQPESFLFFSDTQADPEIGDYSNFGKLLSQSLARGEKPDLVLFGGDTINNGKDAAEWQEFRKATAIPLSGLTTAAIPGNHDHSPRLVEEFTYPQQAEARQSEGYFYSFDAGNVHFIMLDSNIMGAANQVDIDWLKNDLQSQEARQAAWRVAIMHHPMWPVTANLKDQARAQTMRKHFLPLMETYGIDLLLCGHQHLYARSQPMRGEAVSPDRTGIVQIMAASGDKASYTANNSEFLQFSAQAPNYLRITADQETLTVTAYGQDQRSIDTWAITR